eukprot:COSAG02_NODE_55_length_43887_cov_30.660364_12_plen_74_part_00
MLDSLREPKEPFLHKIEYTPPLDCRRTVANRIAWIKNDDGPSYRRPSFMQNQAPEYFSRSLFAESVLENRTIL